MYPCVGHPNIYNSGPQAPPFATAPPRSFPLTVLRRAPVAAEGPLALTKFLTDGMKHLQILLVTSGNKVWKQGTHQPITFIRILVLTNPMVLTICKISHQVLF